MQRFQERLKNRRNALGWSQVDLAFHSGVSERAIAGYESAGNQPSGSRLEKLSVALGVSTAWLLGGEEPKAGAERKETSLAAPAGEKPSPFSWMELATLEKTLADLVGRLQQCPAGDRRHLLENLAAVIHELNARELNSAKSDAVKPRKNPAGATYLRNVAAKSAAKLPHNNP